MSFLSIRDLKAGRGRLIVAFPEGANTGGMRTDVYKAGESNVSKGEYGNQTLDLLPGTYAVVMAGKRAYPSNQAMIRS